MVDQKDILHSLLEDVALLHGALHRHAAAALGRLVAAGTLTSRLPRLPGALLNCAPADRCCILAPPMHAGLGVKLVVVIGARPQINKAVRESGAEPQYAHGYRVTDPASLQAAIQAAGHARMEIESRLSKVRCRWGSCMHWPHQLRGVKLHAAALPCRAQR